MGYLLASPLRRLMLSPDKILQPFVRPGMAVLEPGPGMGYFTIPLAKMVGPSGRVVAVDIQPRMLANLRKRAAKLGLLEQLDLRLARPESMGIADLAGKVDFALAFAVVHEMPSPAVFFTEAAGALRQNAAMLLAEPAGHVKPADFESELKDAVGAGFRIAARPEIPRSYTAFLTKD